jgi:hypothetical protein
MLIYFDNVVLAALKDREHLCRNRIKSAKDLGMDQEHVEYWANELYKVRQAIRHMEGEIIWDDIQELEARSEQIDEEISNLRVEQRRVEQKRQAIIDGEEIAV